MLAVAATGSLRLTALLVVATTTSLGSLTTLLVVTTTRLGALPTLAVVATAATTLRLRGGYRQLGDLLTAQNNLLLLTLAKTITVLAGAVTTTARSGTTKGKTFCKRIRTAHFIKRSREFLRGSGWSMAA
jgi:hypothetical protein